MPTGKDKERFVVALIIITVNVDGFSSFVLYKYSTMRHHRLKFGKTERSREMSQRVLDFVRLCARVRFCRSIDDATKSFRSICSSQPCNNELVYSINY
jgi:hypothetical protein